MSLGTAIFLSTVLILLALAARQISRKKRWGLVLRVLLAVAICFLLLAVGMWSWWQYQERPFVVGELSAVRLGMKPVDVKLSKGAPANEDSAVPEVDDDGTASLVWGFRETYGDRLLIVHFSGPDPESLSVSIVCEKNGYARLFGLGCYSTEQDVLDKLGQPTTTSISRDGRS